jgi:hypothetical protein
MSAHASSTKNPVFDLSNVRNRIVERRLMKPSELLDHPGQWREHSEEQAAAMAGVLREVGIVDSLKAWYSERAGGRLVTWDGHLRKSLDPDIDWPVDITDLTDAEADYALATHDPITGLASADKAALDALLSSINSSEEAVREMLSNLALDQGLYISIADPGDGETEGFADSPQFKEGEWFAEITLPTDEEEAGEVKRTLKQVALDHGLKFKVRQA